MLNRIPREAMAVVASMIVGIDPDDGIRATAIEQLKQVEAKDNDETRSYFLNLILKAVEDNDSLALRKAARVISMVYDNDSAIGNMPIESRAISEEIKESVEQAYDKFCESYILYILAPVLRVWG